MKSHFNFARTPEIIFGVGKLLELKDLVANYGSRVLLLTGSRSIKQSDRYDVLLGSLKAKGIHYSLREIHREPSPGDVDSIVGDFPTDIPDVVVALGGGSVLDAGKAVSAMLGKPESVADYLEEVGTKIPEGSKVPFIAVPTTAGTGSEATKNAVLSEVGPNGYKKSLRHNNFVPDIALVDPELSLNCPPAVTAASGLDAFTQLLESYVSKKASPLTDSLAYTGINSMKDNLIPAATTGALNLDVRTGMSYAALLSGITLANAGLGIVHGLAAAIGSYYDIPHGVICGTLVGVSTRSNIEYLRKDKKANIRYLRKYAEIGKLLLGNICENVDQCCDYLIMKIDRWVESLNMPRLGKYGFSENDIEKIADATSIKFNPVNLKQKDIQEIILERI